MHYEVCFCPHCATELQPITLAEDGGDKERLRCPACGWTHWNNPTPVLAAIVEIDGKVLLARNAAWPGKMFALITGFMEAGESPQEGIAREVKEETNLDIVSPRLVGFKQFFDKLDRRYLVFFYRADQFSGSLHASREGKLEWVKISDLPKRQLAYNFDRDLEVFLKNDLDEHVLLDKKDFLY